ncbi:hypothetical protein HMPREF9016_02187 [Neisseria sp. oral taxon 014 str. F0314]|nr:hypothetical protein HMPREF9016_02187 [Neisseria sp. oral taxon 014 str. F0314]
MLEIRTAPPQPVGTVRIEKERYTMNDLIKLAAASLIGMSGLAVSATTVAQNMADAAK